MYLPAAQGEQTTPSGPVNPTLQVQATRAELASGELELAGHAPQVAAAVAPVVVKNVPATQSAHTVLPVAVLYLPAAHEVHVPPSGPVNPTLHIHSASAELASG